MPMIARSTMSVLGESAKAAVPAATPKIARPTMRMPLRPRRSPIAPDESNSPARTTV